MIITKYCNNYLQFSRFTQNEVSFVCRLKKNADLVHLDCTIIIVGFKGKI
ncbi:Uncharacterised protein [Candidatus Ornithobacterium hominis]|nr:Uncharacterised protein [Candidatus Ornithobacterium hominis]